jgi:hypothetical protein
MTNLKGLSTKSAFPVPVRDDVQDFMAFVQEHKKTCTRLIIIRVGRLQSLAVQVQTKVYRPGSTVQGLYAGKCRDALMRYLYLSNAL